MNPFHKLDLPDIKLSIHRSCIGIFSRVMPDSKQTTFVAFDFMHGRWTKVALEPSQRIDQVMSLKQNARMGYGFGAFSHLVYLTSTTRWWTHALNSVNEQLVEYEARLQTELSGSHITPETVFGGINQALHSIAAHLHRYISELKSLQGIVTLEQASRGFSQVSSQVEALHDFTRELEKKIENNLALLFNRIQINSNRRLVANGQDMQAILSAMQEDTLVGREMAKASHELAQEMKRDSVAMRTIAVVTMFFLPGATFAVSSNDRASILHPG
ncbi:hypothetical protein N7533_008786 [Penicillium manginii]|uniref:uncharacterized protein n=1 Tax=Penicillium manginii TaxID=203109 RepID=UPI002546A19C|nr:uncharacterized protein N7533_008786 [Penicillium manginii]KAJ5743916.1 hypothetical protein N7533_008786 [Penicillium manginii]